MNTLDLRAEECPMTFVKTKVALHNMQAVNVLEVLLCGQEPLKNVPKAVEENGDKVLRIEHLGGDYNKVVIEKSKEAPANL